MRRYQFVIGVCMACMPLYILKTVYIYLVRCYRCLTDSLTDRQGKIGLFSSLEVSMELSQRNSMVMSEYRMELSVSTESNGKIVDCQLTKAADTKSTCTSA